MTLSPNPLPILTISEPPSPASRLGRTSCLLALANLMMLALALAMLGGLWMWEESDSSSFVVVGLAIVLSNVVVFVGGLLMSLITVAGLAVAVAGLLCSSQSPGRPGKWRCLAGILLHVGMVILSLFVLVLLVRHYPLLRWTVSVHASESAQLRERARLADDAVPVTWTKALEQAQEAGKAVPTPAMLWAEVDAALGVNGEPAFDRERETAALVSWLDGRRSRWPATERRHFAAAVRDALGRLGR